MKTLNLHLIVFIILAVSCTNTRREDNTSTEEKEESKTSQKEIRHVDNDLFLLIAENSNDSVSLEHITTDKHVIAKRDNYSTLTYFVDKHKETLKDVKSVREATYKVNGSNEKVYIREWYFKTPVVHDSIMKKLLKGFNGYAPPVKAPHYVFEKDSKLYVLHVKAEYEREYLNKIKQIINDSILK